MFQSAFGIFSCQNPYNCIETFFLGGLAVGTLYLFIRAYILIKQDQAQILDYTDKIIFYLASIHSGILAFVFMIFINPFFVYVIRALYLVLDIFICTVVAYMYFSQEVHSRIRGAMSVGLVWAGALWLFAVMDSSIMNETNECRLKNIIVFSFSTSVVSVVLLYCGYGSIQIINEVERKQSIYSSDGDQNMWQIRRFQELNERKVQLMTLTAVNTIAPFIQLSWDIVKHNSTATQAECDSMTISDNFVDMFILVFLKTCCNLVPSWGIYYLYYWRNREHFRSDNPTFNRHLNDFDELRSDMIELT